MQLWFLKMLEALRSSYWVVPTIMAILAILLGVGVVYVDAVLGPDWLDNFGWYQGSTAEGAREVLSTIAGTSITVAGVVFSITIVSVAYAASQHGPRLLTNFMFDRGNQITLGTFIATFLYCLVVLRTIRGGQEPFVPDLAIAGALILALCSIGVLIFFIHHVPRTIHVNKVVATIGRQLVADIGRRFPAFIGEEPADEDRQSPAGFSASARPDEAVAQVRSKVTGYIQLVDDDRLMKVACRHDLVLKLRSQPGDYIHAGSVFAEVWPAARLTPEAVAALRDSYSVGDRRTPEQDLRFLTDELVEIATRALSPSINDPFTAISCLDWLGAATAEMARRRVPSRYRADPAGRLRVIANGEDFDAFVERAFRALADMAAGNRQTALHMLRMIDDVAGACPLAAQLRCLVAQADYLVALAERKLDAPQLTVVRERQRELRRLLTLPPAMRAARAG